MLGITQNNNVCMNRSGAIDYIERREKRDEKNGEKRISAKTQLRRKMCFLLFILFFFLYVRFARNVGNNKGDIMTGCNTYFEY